MGVDILLGLQWGDEGKGKIVDYLAPKYDIVARFQGGPNAGHTLEFDGIKHVLHQIPSGVFHKHVTNVIGNGVVLDPIKFKEESDALKDKFGINLIDNLIISNKAQIIIPTHRSLDIAQEAAKGDNKIGSTKKGIGPTYQDKIGRQGLRVGDIISGKFKEKYDALVEKHLVQLKQLNYNEDFSQEEKDFFEAVEFMSKFDIRTTEYFLEEQLDAGKSVLAEGAQGSLLDIDYGTYPFVTSSNTTVAGACTGMGIPPSRVNKVIGIFKAYCTRVGSGPFPTELFDADGELLRKEGNEFGSTTGRPRRCGWVDLPALKYSVMLNGVTELHMMKADVLNPFDEIKACTSYKFEDGESKEWPYDPCEENFEPIYTSFKGWKGEEVVPGDYDKLPENLKAYTAFIEKETGVEVAAVSIGPDRTETIIKGGVYA